MYGKELQILIVRSKRTGVVAVLILLTTLSGFLVFNIYSPSNLEWKVDEGDTLALTFNVSEYYRGWDREIDTVSTWTDVIVTISSLPVLPEWKDQNSFIENIVKFGKTDCNHTDLPSNYTQILRGLISLLTMPVGEWTWLDSLYPDSLSPIGYPEHDFEEYFVARLEDDCLYFQRTTVKSRFPNWHTTHWMGWINMTTGLPIRAVYQSKRPDCTEQAYTTLNVTRIT